MGKVLIICSSNIDMVAKVDHLPVPGETVGNAEYFQAFGGKGANQAVDAVTREGTQPSIPGNEEVKLFLAKNKYYSKL